MVDNRISNEQLETGNFSCCQDNNFNLEAENCVIITYLQEKPLEMSFSTMPSLLAILLLFGNVEEFPTPELDPSHFSCSFFLSP